MSESLPTEIWIQILTHLPLSSLHLIKHVNRALYSACREIICSVLDMTMNVKDQDGDELEMLTKRLQDAKTHPQIIKKLCLSPTRVNIREYETPTPVTPPLPQTDPEPLPFWKRIIQKRKVPVQLPLESPPRLHIRLALDKASNLERDIATFIPSLSSLQELDFHQLSGWEGGWYSNLNVAVRVASPHLTVLCLRFSLINELSSTRFGTQSSMFSVALPALHTLRIALNIAPSNDFESGVRKLIASSPHWRALEYCIEPATSSVVSPSRLTLPMSPHSYSRTFKWIAPPFTPISPFFLTHASQFEVVHLNPVPSLDAARLLNFHHLTELRVDLYYSSNAAAELFLLLAHATQLVALEIKGWAYVPPMHDTATLLRQTNLVQLKTLSLGIPLWLLSPQILAALASTAPNLLTLALVSESPERHSTDRTNRCIQENCSSLVSHFSASKVLDWKLCDIGIIVRAPGSANRFHILPLIPLLRVILLKIPSITSFYGTRSLDLWEGIQTEMDEDWGGELWRQSRERW
ncbi:hypothetical protein DL96DRAFT_1635786 [Flagelloscypha sp. PMI_526]|nr:hypothetical protein DL96DRAFT_1635786 [Flagelloscypha sp. PMI_526]